MWLKLLNIFIFLSTTTMAEKPNDPAANQIISFKNRTSGPIGIMTTSAGAPINTKLTVALNKKLMFNEFFMDSITRTVRERIPERVVHAKAAGAFGYFEVTHDITDICKAKLFSKIGKRTPVAARFSPAIVDRGGVDTSRETRGFAIKFYPEDGIFDIVGFNTPMFAYKDPNIFTPFAKAEKRNPATNLIDPNTIWDFITLRPETMHMFLIVFSDRGIPDGYRHMPGFGIHTYQVVNKLGHSYFIRFHFITDQGIKNLRSEEAAKIISKDTDYATRDLYNAIAKGNFPSWTVSIQVLSLCDVKKAGFDVFDVTKILPLDKYPLRPLGRIVLNRNPVNYFAEVEQLAFNPTNLVEGILGAPDKVFESRRFAYRDAQYYRLGANFYNIPVNCPMNHKRLTYNRDGVAPVLDNMRDIPNYYPNSFHGPVPYEEKNSAELLEVVHDENEYNYDQARDLYENELSPDERDRMVENILAQIKYIAKEIQDRAVKLFDRIHPDFGRKVSEGLKANGTYYDNDS